MEELDLKNEDQLQEFYETETDGIKLARTMYNEYILKAYETRDPQQKEDHKNAAFRILGEYIGEEHHLKTIIKPESEPLWVYENGIYTRNAKPIIKNFLFKILREKYTTGKMIRALELIVPETFVKEEDFEEKDTNLICLENGILHILTKELIQHTPKKVFLSKISTHYDVEKKPNKIIELFKEYLPQKDKLETLQELFGYCLYRGHPIHELFILIGDGRNGKGTVLAILEKMLGENNVAHKTLQQLAVDGRSFAIATLHAKLANIGGDIPSTKIQSTAMLKQLTGGDMVSAEIKGVQDPINFKNYAKLIFSCNEMPKWDDDSFGWSSRLRPIVFEKKFLKRKELKEFEKIEDDSDARIAIQNLAELISTEENLSGLLNWSLEGLIRLLKNGEFSDTSSLAERQRILELSASPFLVFAKENLEESFGHQVSKEKLRKEYQRFCKLCRVVPKDTDKDIRKYLTQLFPVQEKQITEGDIRIRVWSGFRLKLNTPDTDIDSSQMRI